MLFHYRAYRRLLAGAVLAAWLLVGYCALVGLLALLGGAARPLLRLDMFLAAAALALLGQQLAGLRFDLGRHEERVIYRTHRRYITPGGHYRRTHRLLLRHEV